MDKREFIGPFQLKQGVIKVLRLVSCAATELILVQSLNEINLTEKAKQVFYLSLTVL